MMKRRIVLAVAMACLASSCQKKATGQTVAVVNGEEITASDLNGELAAENASLQGSTQQVRAQALQNLIDRRLLAQQAHSSGVDKTPDFITQQRRATEELLVRMLLMKQANTAQVPSADQINAFEAANPGIFSARESWTLQQLIFPPQKDPALLAKLKAANSLDEVGQALTAAGVQYTKGSRTIDTASLPPPIYAQLKNLKPNEPFIVPASDREVASVIANRTAAPLNPEQARTVALNGIKRDQIQKFVQDRVKNLKASAKIDYQPGYAPAKS